MDSLDVSMLREPGDLDGFTGGNPPLAPGELGLIEPDYKA
jgi:hypothetical protein